MTAPIRECKRCQGVLTGRQRTYCSANCQKAETKDKYLQATYNITLDQWQQLLDYQGGVCAICQRPAQGRRLLVVDHEHDGGPSGKVRGLICSTPCNLRLVAKHKTGEQLRRAADYVDNPPAVRLFGVVIASGTVKKRKPRKSRRKKT